MDRFEAPSLLKRSTYQIIAEDEYDTTKDPVMCGDPTTDKEPVVCVRPVSSASSQSSDTLQNKRQSTGVMCELHRRRKKPSPGDRFLRAFRRMPLIYKGLITIILTGLPFGLFTGLAFTKYYGQCIGEAELGVTYTSFAMYLNIGWAVLLIILALAEVTGQFFSWLCNLFSATKKFAPIGYTMWFRVTMMLWIGAMRLATCQMWPTSMEKDHMKNWVFQLRLVLEFVAIAAFILVVQGVLLQYICVQYIQGYIGPRSEHAMNELETLEKLNSMLRGRRRDSGSKLVTRIVNKLFMPRRTDVFDVIRKGKSNCEEVRGYAAILWTTVAGSKKTITLVDIYEHLVQLKRDTDGAAELFSMLDRSGDGIVNKQEWEEFIVQTALQLKKRAGAMKGINLLMQKLEIMFTLVVIGAIVFVYTAFFGGKAAANIGSLWTGIVAISFAFAGPITDLVNSCIWVFARHSYDVGDKIEVMGKTLEVRQIFLTHTNFEEHLKDKKKIVQISHAHLTNEALVNVTRSEDPMEGFSLYGIQGVVRL